MLVGVGVLGVFVVKYQKPVSSNSSIQRVVHAIHYADRSEIPISAISIRAVYFVPNDAVAMSSPTWKTDIETSLQQVRNFYVKQLPDTPFVYTIFPQVVIGEQERAYYDGREEGFKTSGGNPIALQRVKEELDARMLSTGGDLYAPGFVSSEQETFTITVIIYEGVGASAQVLSSSVSSLMIGDNPAILLARAFLSSPSYADYGVTLFAHELGHGLGLMHGHDNETQESTVVTSNDIMGLGRFRPLDRTYLSKENKQSLGFEY